MLASFPSTHDLVDVSEHNQWYVQIDSNTIYSIQVKRQQNKKNNTIQTLRKEIRNKQNSELISLKVVG